MNILLLRPAEEESREIAKVLPLGLLSVGTALKKAGHDVRLLDLRMASDPETALSRALGEFRPHLAGIGLLSVEARPAHALARRIKETNRDILVAFGGPHCDHEPRYILHDPSVDYVVMGEGEVTAVELAAALESGAGAASLRGIACRGASGGIRKNPAREAIADLDSLDIDYGLIDVRRYFRYECSADFLPSSERFLPIMTSRGCPYGCIYCHELFGKTVRYRSPESIVAEIARLKEAFDVREVQILDDVFNINMKRAKKTFDLLAEQRLGVGISFPNGVRADLIDDEMILKMRAAGVYRLALGIESGARRIQEMIDKSLDIGILKTVVGKLQKAGISVHGFFMMGFPTETAEEITKTIRLACDLDLATANFSLVMPNPGTRLRAMTQASLAVDEYDFSAYAYDSGTPNTSRVAGRELAALRRHAYRRFYLNPRRIWNMFRLLPAKKVLWRKTPFRLLMKNGFSSAP